MNLERGQIYYITFPYTFDKNFPHGKSKFVLVLQEGNYFKKYDTVEVLLVTSEKDDKNHEIFETDVIIEKGTTKLNKKSWICCSQPYPIRKELFKQKGVWCAGKLLPEKMDEVDESLYLGLCMGLQNELYKTNTEEYNVTNTKIKTFAINE